jgi:hypothetical protein
MPRAQFIHPDGMQAFNHPRGADAPVVRAVLDHATEYVWALLDNEYTREHPFCLRGEFLRARCDMHNGPDREWIGGAPS